MTSQKDILHLDPISPPRGKSARVASRILELIRHGALQVGSRLPSEREMSDQLGVSRTVVREALSALHLSGVLERRAGDGTYIRSTPSLTALQAGPLLHDIEASTSLLQVLQAREALEISVAKLVIDNADEQGIQKAGTLLLQMRQAKEDSHFRQYIHLTLDFHLCLAAAAGNPYLEETLKFLVDVTRQYVWVLERNYNVQVAANSLEIHQAILDAIKAKDLDAVISAVHSHYTKYPTLGGVHGQGSAGPLKKSGGVLWCAVR